ncbi:MAG: glycerate kinase [Solobacterium sp.]|jgi:hydroxypyruvate reductase|nr:glycerate kinase [Solobacterium sp.]MCH4048984.1 glycerate kinase [Solobacterium sp.]MCH4074262.1 glycerate kinase [Solobacterium sp.]MCI1313541.1 glycerate kinase [Solobacterium sp.]MCI1345751.1 glycerate kinase [Solobacterium sp.]
MNSLYQDAQEIMHASIEAVLPDAAVQKALKQMPSYTGRLIVIGIGKAAFNMCEAAEKILAERITAGLCITKYHHVKHPLHIIQCMEAGHPISDENTIQATRKAEELVKDLRADDLVLFLVSGGGSALFEDPLIDLETLQKINTALLRSGASIREINTVRKHLSHVKGGRFARLCEPARVYQVVLSDIIGNPLDAIASGPAYPDSTSSSDASAVLQKYGIDVNADTASALCQETPDSLDNVKTCIAGSVEDLSAAARQKCRALGYETYLLTSSLDCEAKEAGAFLSAIAREHCHDNKNIAILAAGETVVHVRGNGRGGRNQELVLLAAKGISSLDNALIFSFGSDGTDGPTDAAGGIVDGSTAEKLKEKGIDIDAVLNNNDAWHALKEVNGLLITGPTGTNVNDLSVILIQK